jgi:hypothetical protein
MNKAANLKILKTWDGRSSFLFSGSVANGTEVYYGTKPSKEKVTASNYNDIFSHFKGKTVDCGLPKDKADSESMDQWLKNNVSITTDASCVGAILVSEGYAKKKGNQIEFHMK